MKNIDISEIQNCSLELALSLTNSFYEYLKTHLFNKFMFRFGAFQESQDMVYLNFAKSIFKYLSEDNSIDIKTKVLALNHQIELLQKNRQVSFAGLMESTSTFKSWRINEQQRLEKKVKEREDRLNDILSIEEGERIKIKSEVEILHEKLVKWITLEDDEQLAIDDKNKDQFFTELATILCNNAKNVLSSITQNDIDLSVANLENGNNDQKPDLDIKPITIKMFKH